MERYRYDGTSGRGEERSMIHTLSFCLSGIIETNECCQVSVTRSVQSIQRRREEQSKGDSRKEKKFRKEKRKQRRKERRKEREDEKGKTQSGKPYINTNARSEEDNDIVLRPSLNLANSILSSNPVYTTEIICRRMLVLGGEVALYVHDPGHACIDVLLHL